MAKKERPDLSPTIRSLKISLPLYQIPGEKLNQRDLEILNAAYSIYLAYCKSILGYEVNPSIADVQSFHKNVAVSEINDLISGLLEIQSGSDEESQEKTKKQEASIPPELESLVAEYKNNQSLLQQEEIKNNSQRSVAEQVKIAIKHHQIQERALNNRYRRQEQGEKIATIEETLVSKGSPKSSSSDVALSSYKAVQAVALTYGAFSQLPSEVQNKIISSAVELNTVGITDIDTAIQAATLELDTSTLDDSTQKQVAAIPGGFVSAIYKTIIESDQEILKNETQISSNEEKILQFQEQGKIQEAKSLLEENQHLLAYNENQSTKLNNEIANQTATFKAFVEDRETRLSSDPDLRDLIENANQTVSTIQSSLENNGVQPHIYTPMDDADLLEKAIRRDLPGVLSPHAGYDAEYAAALLRDPKTQNEELSPESILLYGEKLTPDLFAKARQFAQDHPDSSLGKLFKSRPDIFNSTSTQLRKIAKSPLGKEISSVKTGIGKAFGSISGFFSKISDKIPGGFGTVMHFASDPWGAIRSFVGRKAGEYIVKRLAQRLTNETLKKGAEMLLKNGLKESVKKLAQQVAVKIAAKVGAKVALQAAAQAANVVPGLGLLIAVVIEVASWLFDKIKGFVKKLSTSLYGEEIKARDLLVLPAAGISAVFGGVGSVLTAFGTATVAAAGSALTITVAGSILGLFFYITSIVTAPLISTLVQLQATTTTSVDCSQATFTNDKKICRSYNNIEYCFPVNDASSFNYATEHHEYPAADIFRNGDIAGSEDDIPIPILAYVAGTVTWISENDSLGGYSFTIKGVDGMYYYYAHNMCNLVTNGQTVNAGDVIAGMDSSGNAITTPEHLHFQISDQENMVTTPENYPHLKAPWDDFCIKLGMCGSHVGY